MAPKVFDLYNLGCEWNTKIFYYRSPADEDVKKLTRKINETLNSCTNNKITVTKSWFGDGRQLLVKSQNHLHAYRNFMNSFATNLDATKWILSFLAGKIDMNHLYYVDYIDEVRSFVCITCMAEVARGYGKTCLDELQSFLYELINCKKNWKGNKWNGEDWKSLKKRYPPALSYKEDGAYIPETEDNVIPYMPDKAELREELNDLLTDNNSILYPQANTFFPCSSSFNSTRAFFP